MTEEKKTATRVYRVRDRITTASMLVRATSKPAAVNHAARDRLEADVATQDDLIELLAAGVQIQEAGRAA